MTSTSQARWARIQELFHIVVDLPAADRDAYLARACADDAPMIDDVLGLVAGDRQPASVLDRGMADVASGVIGDETDLPGRRFSVDDTLLVDLWLSGTVMF